MAEYAASILAIVGSGITVSKVLHGLVRTWKDAPDELFALANEVSDTILAMDMAKVAFIGDGFPKPAVRNIALMFERANVIFLELQDLSTGLDKAISSTHSSLGRGLWLREKSKTKALQKKLRRIRTDIMSVISIETLLISKTTSIDVNELKRLVVAGKHHTQATVCPAPNEATEEMNNRIVKGEKDLGSHLLKFPVHATYSGSPCTTPCSCDCHRNRNFRFANKFLGALFFGYQGLPITSIKCNEWACRRHSQSSLQVAYFFPRWFFQYALYMFFGSLHAGCGPQMTLAVARVIPATAESFEHVWTGNLDAAKVLFSARDATPMDVDDMDGGSYLNYALRSRNPAMSSFIFEMPGTNPSMEDQFGESPVDVAWQLILSHKAVPEFETWLRARLAYPERLQGRQFTVLHKIVCGLCQLDLDKELQTSTAAINTTDSGNWTPLIWASYCQDWRTIGLLLSYGADANILNRKGQLALHLVCKEGDRSNLSTECLATIGKLVAATSNVNTKDVYGDTPLMYAAEHDNDPRILEVLYNAGASLSEVDCTGHTAMHVAIYFDNWRAVETLVALGAEIDRASSGDTPLMKTLICNAHNSMRALFRAKADIRPLDLEGQTILHLAAMYADSETLKILTIHLKTLSIQPTIGRLDPDVVSEKNQTAEQVFSDSRLLVPNDATKSCWQRLITDIRAEWQRRESSVDKVQDILSSAEEGLPLIPFTATEDAEVYYDAQP